MRRKLSSIYKLILGGNVMKNIVVYGLGDLGRKIAKELKDRQNKKTRSE